MKKQTLFRAGVAFVTLIVAGLGLVLRAPGPLAAAEAADTAKIQKDCCGGPEYFSLSLCTTTGGTITGDPAGTVFVSGTSITVTADPDPGYVFDHWTGCIGGTDNPYQFYLTNMCTICAVFVADSTAPAITLIGDNPLYVECGGTYTDPGATASDNQDGDISADIVVGGDTVDVDTLGTYTITYDVTDEAENDATQVTRTVIVEDTAPPVIALTGPASVSLDFANWFVETGVSAADVCDGDVTDQVSVWTDLDVFTAGTYTYEYDVMDSQGNAAATASRTITIAWPTPQTLTYSVTGAGTLAFSPTPYDEGTGYVTYMGGTEVKIAVVPNDPGDTLFAVWGGTDAGSLYYNPDGTYRVLLNRDMTVSASLAASAKLTITVESQELAFGPDYAPIPEFDVQPLLAFPSGYGFNYEYVAIFNLNDDVTVTLPDTQTVGEYSAFDHWVCAGESFDQSEDYEFDITMDGDKAVELATLPWIKLRIVDDRLDLGGGQYGVYGDATFTVTPTSDQYPVEWTPAPGWREYALRPGAAVSLTPAPEEGYVFNNWEVTDLDNPPAQPDETGDVPLNLTMDGGWAVHPLFSEGRTLTVTGPDGGSLALLPPDPSLLVADGDPDTDEVYGDGTLVRVRAAASPGYIFLGWGGDLAGQENAVFLEDGFENTTLDPPWIMQEGNFGPDGQGHLRLTTATDNYAILSAPNTRADGEFRFSYKRVTSDTWFEAALRLIDGNNYVFVQFRNDYLWLRENIDGVKYYRSSAVSEPTAAGTWYHVYARCKGATVEVYRAVDTGPYELVASSSNIAIRDSVSFRIATYAENEYLFDDVEFRNLPSDAYVTMDADKTASASFGAEDNDPPVIHLVPPTGMTLECGGVFEEPGYSVEDEGYVEDLASRVVATGAVDTAVPDVYTLAYDVMDGIVPGTGNAADTVYRTVTVVDTTPPEITLDGPNPMGIGLGGAFTEPSASAVDGCDPSSLTVTSDAATALDTGAYGTYTVTYSATDAASNTGTATRTVVVGYTLSIDQERSGAVDPAPGDHYYEPDTVVEVTATPLSNFDHWEGDDVDQETDNVVHITMDGDKAITAVFVGQAVTFTDSGLAEAIRIALGKGDEDDIYAYELAGITYLDGSNLGITNLAGLEQLTGLTELRLNDNYITNLSPLSGLTNLVTLELAGNGIANLSPLSGLTGLQHLNLAENNINSISALSGLTGLLSLNLGRNSVSSPTALTAMTSLTQLNLEQNGLTYLNGLEQLTNLEYLYLGDNTISDISALQGLTNLHVLEIPGNNIEEISGLVLNGGLGPGDIIDGTGNPFTPEAQTVQIPAVIDNGAEFLYDSVGNPYFSAPPLCSRVLFSMLYPCKLSGIAPRLETLPDGGYFIIYDDTGSIIVRKLNSYGDEMWAHVYPYSEPYANFGRSALRPDMRAVTNDNDLIVVDSSTNGLYTQYLFKIGSDGNEEWRVPVAPPFNPAPNPPLGVRIYVVGIVPTTDGGVLVGGNWGAVRYPENPNFYPIHRLFVMKFDSSGTPQWTKSDSSEFSTRMQFFSPALGSGAIFSPGEYSWYWDPDPPFPEHFWQSEFVSKSLLGVSDNGAEVWSRDIPAEEYLQPAGYRQDHGIKQEAGTYVLRRRPYPNIEIIRLDSSGNELETLDNSLLNAAWIQTSDGGYLTYYNPYSEFADIGKFDENLDFVWGASEEYQERYQIRDAYDLEGTADGNYIGLFPSTVYGLNTARLIKFTDECSEPGDTNGSDSPGNFEERDDNAPGGSSSGAGPETAPQNPGSPSQAPNATPAGNYGDPVNLFSGEFVENMTDLQVASPGFDFNWSRIYRSKQFTENGMGANWDYAYNMWIKRQTDGQKVKVHDGRSGREEIFNWDTNDGCWYHDDYPARVAVVDVGGQELPQDAYYELTYWDGTRYRFFPLDASFGGKQGKLCSITDRNGNAMHFRYESTPGGGARLYKITDTAGRAYYIDYYSTGRISKLRDFTGRTVTYGYSDEGDLAYARDAAGQKVNEYDYQDHLLTAIVDGNGQTYVSNIYDTTSTDFMKHRVIRQYYGNAVYDFSYEDLCPDDNCGSPGGYDKWRTTVNDGEGNVTVTAFDSLNRTRSSRVYTAPRDPEEVTTFAMLQSAGLTVKDEDYLETSYQYDGVTSLVTRVTHPAGDYETFTYGGAEASEDYWWARGNLRTATYHNIQEQTTISESWDYESGHGNFGTGSRFVKRHTDGRGNASVATFDSHGNVRTRSTDPDIGILETFTYNRRGQVASHALPENVDEHRRVDFYTYNHAGYLTQVIVDLGGENLTTTYAPNAVGLVAAATDARGKTTTRGYDHRDRLQWVKSPLLDLDTDRQVEIHYEYDGNNNLTKTLTRNFDETGQIDTGNEWIERVMAYNTLNSLTDVYAEQADQDFVHTRLDYDKNENVVKVWTPLSLEDPEDVPDISEPDNTVEYVYDTRQMLVEEYHGTAYTVEYVRDLNGNVLEVHGKPADPNDDPRVTINTYDGYNRLHTITDPMGNEIEYGYDNNGNVTAIAVTGELEDTAAAGSVRMAEMARTYDSVNRPTFQTVKFFDPSGQSDFGDGESAVEQKYDPFGNVYEIVDPNGHSVYRQFDTANRLKKTLDELGNTVTYTLDGNGNPTNIVEVNKSDLENPDVTYTYTVLYDALNRAVQASHSGGITVQAAYDSRGNVTQGVDGEGNVTRMAYDGLGRPVETARVVPGGSDVVTGQAWDLNSRIETQTDPNGNATAYTYDEMNRLDYVTYADGTVTDYGYDSFGSQTYSQDANGTETDIAYDLLGRPVSETVTVVDPNGAIDGTTSETFKYDSLSNLIYAENDASIVTRVFDSMSNLRSETLKFKDDNFEKTITHTYDDLGNTDYTAYPGGRTIQYAFDALERVSTVHSSQGGEPSMGLLAGYDYLGAGRVERRNVPGNSTYTDYGFDAAGRINATNHIRINPDTSETAFDARTYTWDDANNKTQRVELAGGVPVKIHDYEYDALNRMWQSTKTLASPAAGTPASWSGAMTLSGVSPGTVAFTGGEAVSLTGDFIATYDPGTLGVYITKVQGTGDLQQDYTAAIVNATASQIDVLAPARGEQGAFDIYASALDGSTPVNSNPLSFTYGPQVTTYNLDGAGNREDVVTATGTEDYTQDNTDPDPDDAAMNQYTQTPLDVADRVYDGNGNLLHTGAAFPTRYRHDYLDRITQAVGMPAIGGGTVPAGSEFTDDFTGGKDAAWEFNPAITGGIMSTQWNATNDTLVSSGSTGVASAYPRTDPDGDFWWVYTRPSGASGNNIMAAYLRALGQEDDIIGSPPTLAALYLDITVSGVSLVQSFGGFTASSGAITTDEDTPYLIHVHVVGSTIVVRRGEVGGTMATILETDSAPLQDTDRFILESASPCIVDDVNIGHFKVEYTYDALGRRIERRVDNGGDRSKTRFIYDGVHVAEEWDIPESGSPTLDASYVYGLYVDDVLTMRRGGEDYYYHADDLGNVMKLTDSDGEVVEGYDYGDYGAPEFYDENGALTTTTASALGNPYLFTGRRWDPELGYYCYRNRYLDPALGRFTTRDPIGIWGDALNLGNGFTYAASCPWSLVDPFGLSGGNRSAEFIAANRAWGQQQWAAIDAQRGQDSFWAGAGAGISSVPRNFVLGVKGLVWTGPKNAVVGTYTMVRHPIRSVQGISGFGSALYNDFGGTTSAIGHNLADAATDPEAIGAFTFDIISAVGTGGAVEAVKGTGAAQKVALEFERAITETRGAALNPFARGALRRGRGGRGGGPAHAEVQQAVQRAAGGRQEVPVKLGDTGLERVVDVKDAQGRLHQIGDMRQRGGYRPSARERGAIEDLRKANQDTTIIYHDKNGSLPSLINPDLQSDWIPAPARYRKF